MHFADLVGLPLDLQPTALFALLALLSFRLRKWEYVIQYAVYILLKLNVSSVTFSFEIIYTKTVIQCNDAAMFI